MSSLKFFLVFLSFSLLICLFCACWKRNPERVTIAYQVLNKHILEMKKQHNMRLFSYGGGFIGGVNELNIGFSVEGVYDVSSARKLFILAMEDLLEKVNHSEALRPHLSSYPFTFENIQYAGGEIQLALYNSEESFLEPEKAIAQHSYKVTDKGQLEVTLDKVVPGEYAIAVFHDENSNEKLETNLFGIPVEPYAFSGSDHSRWRPPYYKNAKFNRFYFNYTG